MDSPLPFGNPPLLPKLPGIGWPPFEGITEEGIIEEGIIEEGITDDEIGAEGLA